MGIKSKRPRVLSAAGFVFWYAAFSITSSVALLFMFEFDKKGDPFYGSFYGITVIILLLLAVHNIFRSTDRRKIMLISLIIISIVAHGWIIDLCIWSKLTKPHQLYMLLLAIGQVLLEIVAGTVTFVVALRRNPDKTQLKEDTSSSR